MILSFVYAIQEVVPNNVVFVNLNPIEQSDLIFVFSSQKYRIVLSIHRRIIPVENKNKTMNNSIPKHTS